MELTVCRYEDGIYEAYDAQSDTRHETKNWGSMRLWLREFIDDLSVEVEALNNKEEACNGF